VLMQRKFLLRESSQVFFGIDAPGKKLLNGSSCSFCEMIVMSVNYVGGIHFRIG
jgi:hypothetical protein